MTKSDIVNEVAKATGLTKKDAAGAVDAFIKSIVDALSKGEEVQIMGFGTFEVRNRLPERAVTLKTQKKSSRYRRKRSLHFEPGRC